MQRILIAGASGFIGSALKKYLVAQGYYVATLVRREPTSTDEVFWNPPKQELALTAIENFDVFINLSGENLTAGRWTKSFKQKIIASRIDCTKLLAECILKLKHPPKKFLSASAIGIYSKDPCTEGLVESSPLANDFLAEVCKSWEAAANHAHNSKTQVVNLRISAVIGVSGGMLAKLLPSFRWGLGASLGKGNQYLSWVALEDLLAMIEHLINVDISGPVNICSPNPVTNLEFSKKLAKQLKRYCYLKVPALFLKIIFGKEFSEQVLLASQKILPEKMVQSGYEFKTAKIEQALAQLN